MAHPVISAEERYRLVSGAAEIVADGYRPGSMMTVCPGRAAFDAAPIVQNGRACDPLPLSEQFAPDALLT